MQHVRTKELPLSQRRGRLFNHQLSNPKIFNKTISILFIKLFISLVFNNLIIKYIKSILGKLLFPIRIPIGVLRIFWIPDLEVSIGILTQDIVLHHALVFYHDFMELEVVEDVIQIGVELERFQLLVLVQDRDHERQDDTPVRVLRLEFGQRECPQVVHLLQVGHDFRG